VLFVFHGGMEVNKPQYMFDAVLHQFPSHRTPRILPSDF
jgi:hypothetical protein